MNLREAKVSYFTAAAAGEYFIDGVVEDVDAHKWKVSEKNHYDFGWERAAIDWWRNEYKKWFNGIVDSEAFEILLKRGNQKEKNVADFFVKIGERLMEFPEERALGVLNEFRKKAGDIVSIVERETPKKRLEDKKSTERAQKYRPKYGIA